MALTLYDLLARKTSVKLNIAEDIVEAIVKHQWKTASENIYKENSVEVSGFCKFKIRPYNISRSIEKYEKLKSYNLEKLETVTDEKEIIKLNKKLETCIDILEYLNTKL
jgi:nucleoid DNA-binding protein